MRNNSEVLVIYQDEATLTAAIPLRRTIALNGNKLPKQEQKKKAKAVTPPPRPSQQRPMGQKG